LGQIRPHSDGKKEIRPVKLCRDYLWLKAVFYWAENISRLEQRCELYETLMDKVQVQTCGTGIPKADTLNLENYNMYRARDYIASLFLTAVLVAPVSMMATPAPEEGVQVRVYDKDHKDYHNWDDNENRNWGQFLTENHRKSHEFAKSNKKEQSQYWKWRHSHPDKN
jgi:hypothetical protein